MNSNSETEQQSPGAQQMSFLLRWGLATLLALGMLIGFFPSLPTVRVIALLALPILLVIMLAPSKRRRPGQTPLALFLVWLIGLIAVLQLQSGLEQIGFDPGKMSLVVLEGCCVASIAMLVNARMGEEIVERAFFLAGWLVILLTVAGIGPASSVSETPELSPETRLTGSSGSTTLTVMAVTVLAPYAAARTSRTWLRFGTFMAFAAMVIFVTVKAWSATGIVAAIFTLAIGASALNLDMPKPGRRFRLVVATAAIVVLSMAAANLAGSARVVEKLSSSGGETLSGRTYIWAAYWEVVKQNLLLGSGSPVVQTDSGYSNAHNSILEILALGGLILLMLTGMWIILAFKSGSNNRRWVAAMTGMLIFSLTNAVFFIPLAWAVLGAAWSGRKDGGRPHSRVDVADKPYPKRRLATVAR